MQTAKPTKGKFDQLLHSINELLQNNVLSTELPIKKHPRLIDMQRLLTLQDEVQRVHLGVEIISRVNESVLSITKKVQNG